MIVSASKDPTAPSLLALSPRECDVLRHLIHGRSPSEIADLLHLSDRTVRTYILLLARGVGVRGMRQLVIWGVQNPGATSGRPARAGLHMSDCACGSAACLGKSNLRAA